MAEFKVHGPYPIAFEDRQGGRLLTPDSFWEKNKSVKSLRSRKGVYVFAIKPSGTTRYTPYYVGKATKSFGQEVFNSSNQVKYQRAFSQFAKGRPWLFLVVHPDTKKKVHARHIKQIEDHFVALGAQVNGDIENVHGTSTPGWAISGVIRSKTHKISAAARKLRAMFKMD